MCERTLKYFQGIAGRKWVVSVLCEYECCSPHTRVNCDPAFTLSGDFHRIEETLVKNESERRVRREYLASQDLNHFIFFPFSSPPGISECFKHGKLLAEVNPFSHSGEDSVHVCAGYS